MEKPTVHPIEVCLAGQTRTYTAEFQMDPRYAEAWKRVLLLSHGKAEVRCLCPGSGDKRLSIHSRSNSDRFHLARFPETGPEHSEDCVYYGVDPGMSGLGSYRRGVVQELDDGSTKIKLKVGLQQKASSAPEDADSSLEDKKRSPTARARSGQTSMTLLGLLHYLWTAAALNVWAPSMQDKRNLGVLHYHLLRVASTTYAGRVRLSSNLVIATSAPAGAQADLNKAKAIEAMNQRRRLVVIAPLAQYQAGMESITRLPIAGFHGIPHLSLSDDSWNVLKRRFEGELNGWMSGDQVVAIAQTDAPRPAAGVMRAQVVDAGLMRVTQQWIPIDSGYEAAVASALVAAQRRFEKPLRFDAGEDQVFPDFWLKDRGRALPMEVWGLTDPEYLARKEKKTSYYDETYGAGNWWQWDAASGGPIPPFP